MWSNQKMKFVTFIHSDDVKCFHVDVQGTHKLVVTSCINFKDHVLIKRQWVGKKKCMQWVGSSRTKKKGGNHRK
jgi:hypothetical protein